MNRRLLDPFQAVQLPEIIEEYLEHGSAACLAFNRRGTLLAVGTQEGGIVLWDFDTRGVARTLAGHSKPVTGLSWSRNGKYLASGSADQTLILWDVLAGTQALEVHQPAAITHVSLSPRAPYSCVVSLAGGAAPVIVDLQSSQERALPLLDVDAQGKQGRPGDGGSASPAVALFSKDARVVLMGQGRGIVSVLDPSTLRVLDAVKVSNMARILGLRLNAKGTLLLANCHDRVIRLLEVLPLPQQQQKGLSKEEACKELGRVNLKAAKTGSLLWGPDSSRPGGTGLLQPVREFQNAVEKMLWADVAFTSDSEHIIAAASSKAAHHLYVWNRVNGKMERILEGPKEGVLALAWHPLRTCLLSASTPGRVYIWARHYAENWSAFAPDFKELDENVEYVEKEDEFDWATPGASGHHEKMVAQEQAAAAAQEGKGLSGNGPLVEEVDVVTLESECIFSSDEEEELEDQLHYLPAEIEVEELPAPQARVDGQGDEIMEGPEEQQAATHEQQQQQQQQHHEEGAAAIEEAGEDEEMPLQGEDEEGEGGDAQVQPPKKPKRETRERG